MTLTETITWIPVAEGLPESGVGCVLVYITGKVGAGYYAKPNNAWVWHGRVVDFGDITHWSEPLRGPVLDQVASTP